VRSSLDRTAEARARARQGAAFDLTFSAPKSVSVLFAVADEPVAAALLEAHEQAVDAAYRGRMTPSSRGLLEIHGVPLAVLREFSRRRAEIEERAEALTGVVASELSRTRAPTHAPSRRRWRRARATDTKCMK
jgi:hypothetical protein